MKTQTRLEEIKKIIKQFQGKRILVIGDIMLDKYIWGDVERISPEAPVPVLNASNETYNLGGAANVAGNIKALGGIPILVGVVGKDEAGHELNSCLQNKGLNTNGIFVDPARITTTKTRLVVEKYSQQLVRIDMEKKEPISKKLGKKIFEFISSLSNIDAVLFEDYDKGMLYSNLIKKIINLFRGARGATSKVITVDPKFDHFFDYKGVTLFKPNKKETELAMGIKLDSKNISSVSSVLRKKLKCDAILLTLGKEGMFLFDSKEHRIPTQAQEVFDEAGAGDIVIAVATIALSTGASFLSSAYIANIAAGIEVRKFGVVPVTPEELLREIE